MSPGISSLKQKVKQLIPIPHRVLVTGSAGTVGRTVCAALIERGHKVRGLDTSPTPGVDDAVIGDIADRPTMLQAMDGCNTVVHLAAYPNDADFLDVLLAPNVIGLYQVFDAARRHQVRRLVFASTMQIVSGAKDESAPLETDRTCPTNHYALTKVWAEQMGEMYARTYGMSILGMRIGWFVQNPDSAKKLKRISYQHLYLSPGDLGRFIIAAVDVEHTGYTTLYATSADGLGHHDLDSAREIIGYVPQDRWPTGIDPAWLA